MRVIAGKARHLNLKTIPGDATRPTTDKTKETLFNVINNRIPDSRFLDLFSGSGAIGIEALSRGCQEAVLVEKNRKAAVCITENLKFTKLLDDANLMTMDVFSAISTLETKGMPFDIIFMDPPYNHELEKKVLEKLAHSVLVDIDTLIIVESSKETDLSYCSELGYNIIKEKVYKTNKHTFLERLR